MKKRKKFDNKIHTSHLSRVNNKTNKVTIKQQLGFLGGKRKTFLFFFWRKNSLHRLGFPVRGFCIVNFTNKDANVHSTVENNVDATRHAVSSRWRLLYTIATYTTFLFLFFIYLEVSRYYYLFILWLSFLLNSFNIYFIIYSIICIYIFFILPQNV